MLDQAQSKPSKERWFAIVVAAWLIISIWFIYQRWHAITWFALGDTDDNMRLMQVRAWLNGQAWSDLRQYRLTPPQGADIHWSRFVDLPLAGLMLLFRPFIGVAKAEYVAVTLAPMIPMLVALTGLSVAARWLLDRWAYVLSIAIFLFCQGMLSMYMPTRIDHHGWQLAFLPWLVVGIADDNRWRGGVIIGIASALSLVIGLEMMPYLLIVAGVVGLRWIIEPTEAERLRTYALSLAGGTAIGFLIFASEMNRLPRCDALSPVWLSVALIAGGLLFLLSFMKSLDWRIRLASAGAAAALVGAYYGLAWPHCLGRPEGITPELDRLWFSQIREVKPITDKSIEVIWALGFSAVIGPIGAFVAMMRARGTSRFPAWAAILLLSVCSGALLFWQSRVGAAVQMLSIPGATALGWIYLPRMRASGSMLVRIFGTLFAFALISGLAVQLGLMMLPTNESDDGGKKDLAGTANAKCATIPALAPIGHLAPATIFTFVDLSPRLIALTHHSAIAGPYHRNGPAILDVHHFFRGSAGEAEQIIRKHNARYVLICPNSSESTIYKAEKPKGFYAQLAKGIVPGWLKRVTLPTDSPYIMWELLPVVSGKPS
jgi:hypothetical protein